MVPLVPTYIWPTDDEAYKRAISGYMPGLAIVTGDNSGPGTAMSNPLAERIQWLVDRSWQAVGYVRLDYMKRSILDITADVARWRVWYPKISGFFFDECPTMKAGALEAASALEALAMQHGSFCVFNPGAPVDSSWFDVLTPLDDRDLRRHGRNVCAHKCATPPPSSPPGVCGHPTGWDQRRLRFDHD